LQNGIPSSLVVLGDFVKKPDLWNHRFFLTEMIREINPPFPVFLVPGNHDIDYRGAIKDERRRTTPEIFEFLYGPKKFHFIYNDCLFIISEIEAGNPTAYMDYLRTALAEKGQGRKHIFVFIHVPPRWLTAGLGVPYPREKEFFSLLETYKVTTCFFGDYHGYIRAWRGGTNFIVSGGTGGHLEGEAFEWGHLHHILKVNVDHDTISENLIMAPEGSSFEDIFENWVFLHLFPLIEERGWILYLPFGLFLSTGVCSLLFFVFSVKRRDKIVR
jgi:Calcineurin-like phosphoesterase